MKLSAPIYRLKQQARVLSRREGIPHTQALEQVAQREGFTSWGLLAQRMSAGSPIKRLNDEFNAGELVLLGARPGHGKTLLSLELAINAMQHGRHCMCFSLELNDQALERCFAELNEDLGRYRSLFSFDDSDQICAEYMTERLATMPAGSLVVVDYLQALDHKRENASLMAQISQLKAFAAERRLVMIFIAQIHRTYDPERASLPSLGNVRLTNPLDLSLFHKACFMNAGEIQVTAI